MTTVTLNPRSPLVAAVLDMAASHPEADPAQTVADIVMAACVVAHTIGMDDIDDMIRLVRAADPNAAKAAALILETRS